MKKILLILFLIIFSLPSLALSNNEALNLANNEAKKICSDFDIINELKDYSKKNNSNKKFELSKTQSGMFIITIWSTNPVIEFYFKCRKGSNINEELVKSLLDAKGKKNNNTNEENVNSLNGTKLECYGDNLAYQDNTNTYVQEYVAFNFIKNFKVVYSYVLVEDKLKNSDWSKYDLLLDYEVLENDIKVFTNIIPRYHFDTTIDRYDLKLYGHYNPYKSAPSCKIVSYDPLIEIKKIKEKEKKL